MKKYLISSLSSLFVLFYFANMNVAAQEDNTMNTYIKIYEVIDDYPDFSYEYEFEDYELKSVTVKGVPDETEREKLELWLVELKKDQMEMENKTDEEGIYLYTEQEAKPKGGYEQFYENLYENLKYPEAAENKGVEGNVYVRFIVDQNGDILKASAAEDIETPYGYAVDELKEEAVEAVKETSGNWEPATVNGVPVAEWVVLPVQFNFKIDPTLKAPIR
jgi:TonB family protein